jgi:type I restriction enzyme R subunit
MPNEADTCRTYIVPKLHTSGWEDDSIVEQLPLTPGRIVPIGDRHTRKDGLRPDYVLFIRQNIPIAVVEAKADHKNPGDGLQIDPGVLDRFGREIPPGLYGTKDYERLISLLTRTEVVAKHLTEYLKRTNRFDKTIVFCVDQEHALDMRMALNNANADLTKIHLHYVERVVSDEGSLGRGHLDNFQDPEKELPVILTTSQMLTTGVDAPTCRNIVLFRAINSMTDFKQIIGRGTRVSEEHNKFWFTIIDYVGATQLFYDPAFDGDPVRVTKTQIDKDGNETKVEDSEEGMLESEQDPNTDPKGLVDNDSKVLLK